jgi:hypothetical protein
MVAWKAIIICAGFKVGKLNLLTSDGICHIKGKITNAFLIVSSSTTPPSFPTDITGASNQTSSLPAP